MPVDANLSRGQARVTPGGRAAVDYRCAHVFLGAKNGKYPDCNQMVVAGSDSRMAIDSSITAHLIGPEFDSADLMVLSHGHEDHMAGIDRLGPAPLLVPEGDLAAVQSWEGMGAACGFDPAIRESLRETFTRDFGYAPRPDARGYGDGHLWDLGRVRVRAVHTPGHTAGHMALLIEEEGIAYIADIDLSSFGPYYGDASSSLTDFRRSLALVRDLPARIWVTGHHKGIYEDRTRFLTDLDAYAARIDARDAQLLARLTDRPATIAELAAGGLLYPPGFAAIWAPSVEKRVITLHLDLLAEAGEVALDAATGRYHRL